MTPAIDAVDAWEVLDSRGDPTVRVAVTAGDARGLFTVPVGASTGRHEAVEVRDGGDRYDGRGVRTAVRAVRDDLEPVVTGRDVTAQRAVDAALVERDGTETLSALGANAVLGVSGAVAHAAAEATDQPLYRYLAPDSLAEEDRESGAVGRLPLPMVNVLSGGLHAHGGVEVQDFLVVPRNAETYAAAIETVWEVRDAVRSLIVERGDRPLVADEGGFAPSLSGITDAFDLLATGVREAGFEPARDGVAFAVDVAASHFYDAESGTYALDSAGETLTSDEMAARVAEWTESYPVVSVEDPLAEDDWRGWAAFTDRVGTAVQVLGDDLLVTDSDRVERAAEAGVANAVLVKANQAGTVTRTLDLLETADDVGFAPVVSARSGETCDATIADLAVARDAGQIKVGSLARSERLAKYNRLFGIEHRTERSLASPSFEPS
jgi:enolase